MGAVDLAALEMAPIVEVEDLVKRYKNAMENVVEGVSPGEFFALLTPNGAGKTTTLSVLTTTFSPTSGSVAIDCHDVRKEAVPCGVASASSSRSLA